MCMKKSYVRFTLSDFWAAFKGNVGKTDYRKKTDDRPHFIPDLGLYCGKMFRFGNHKLGKHFAIFSLKEVLSCPTAILYGCDKDCYGLKASNIRPTAYNFRIMLTYLAVNCLDLLEEFIIEDLKRRPKAIKFVRIHETGDFISQEYVDMWARVTAAFPELTFYFYTKTADLFDFSGFGPNVAKNNSVIDGRKNYGTTAEIKQLKRENKDKTCIICSYGFESEKECGVKCLFCMTPDKKSNWKYPLFKNHYRKTN